MYLSSNFVFLLASPIERKKMKSNESTFSTLLNEVMMKNMNQYTVEGKILVTGGMGSIGRNLVNKLVKSGQEVVVYDWNDINMSKSVTGKIKYVCGDVRDSRHILRIINKENIKGIVHLAAFSKVCESGIESLQCKEYQHWRNIISIEGGC